MSDDVTISNLAVAFLGDEATISVLDPPEGSPQAEHCAQFLPLARRAMLQMHGWGFATRSVSPTLLQETVRGWQYAYAKPNNCLKVLAILPPGALDDFSVSALQGGISQAADGTIFSLPSGYTKYQQQPFKVEVSDTTDTELILTNQQEAVAICIFDVEDYAKWSPLSIIGLARLLSSFIAGPIYKGKTGVEMSLAMQKEFEKWFALATDGDAAQERTDVQVSTPWIANR